MCRKTQGMLNMVDLVLRSKKCGLKNIISMIPPYVLSSVHGSRHRSLDTVLKLDVSRTVSMIDSTSLDAKK